MIRVGGQGTAGEVLVSSPRQEVKAPVVELRHAPDGDAGGRQRRQPPPSAREGQPPGPQVLLVGLFDQIVRPAEPHGAVLVDADPGAVGRPRDALHLRPRMRTGRFHHRLREEVALPAADDQPASLVAGDEPVAVGGKGDWMDRLPVASADFARNDPHGVRIS
jgi:hypothetical protein